MMRRLFALTGATFCCTAVILNAILLSMNPTEDMLIRVATMVLFVFMTLLWITEALKEGADR